MKIRTVVLGVVAVCALTAFAAAAASVEVSSDSNAFNSFKEDPLEFEAFLAELRASSDPQDAVFLEIFQDEQLQSALEDMAAIDPDNDASFRTGKALEALTAMKTRLSLLVSEATGEPVDFVGDDIAAREAQFECHQCVRLADVFVRTPEQVMFPKDSSSFSCSVVCEDRWWWAAPACSNICDRLLSTLDTSSVISTCVDSQFCATPAQAADAVASAVVVDEGLDPHTLAMDPVRAAVPLGRRAVVSAARRTRTKKAVTLPVVIMHGILASAKDEKWVGMKATLEEAVPDLYVRLMEVGAGKWDSVFTPMTWQAQEYRYKVKDDAKLAGSKKGIHVIGHSQGTLVSRGYIQRFDDVKVRNFIALAGPLPGQYGVPFVTIRWVDDLLYKYAYRRSVQTMLSCAQYWRDSLNLDTFVKVSLYQADLDNYREDKNDIYVRRIKSLDNWVMVRGTRDLIIGPHDAAHFSTYAPGSDKDILPLRESDIYTEDWIGLASLDKAGGITEGKVDCAHLSINVYDDCPAAFDDYIYPYLEPVKIDDDEEDELVAELGLTPDEAWDWLLTTAAGHGLVRPTAAQEAEIDFANMPCYQFQRLAGAVSQDSVAAFGGCVPWCMSEWWWLEEGACAMACDGYAKAADQERVEGWLVDTGRCDETHPWVAPGTGVLREAAAHRSVAFMHGILSDANDHGYNVGKFREAWPGAYVVSMEVGNGKWDTVFMHMADQMAELGGKLEDDPGLAGEFDLVGFSQGGLLTRVTMQNFELPVHRWVSLAGPLAGQYGVPFVNVEWINRVISRGPYIKWIQNKFSPAQYWRSPRKYEKYCDRSTFVATSLCESTSTPCDMDVFRSRITSLEEVLLIQCVADKVIGPPESSWLTMLEEGSGDKIPLVDTPLYQEDWLGFRELDESDRLFFDAVEGCSHPEFTAPSCPETTEKAIEFLSRD